MVQQVDGRRRISLAEIMGHPWLQVPDPEEEEAKQSSSHQT